MVILSFILIKFYLLAMKLKLKIIITITNNTVSTEAFAELSAQLNNCIEKISMLEERINNSNKKKSGDFAI